MTRGTRGSIIGGVNEKLAPTPRRLVLNTPFIEEQMSQKGIRSIRQLAMGVGMHVAPFFNAVKGKTAQTSPTLVYILESLDITPENTSELRFWDVFQLEDIPGPDSADTPDKQTPLADS